VDGNFTLFFLFMARRASNGDSQEIRRGHDGLATKRDLRIQREMLRGPNSVGCPFTKAVAEMGQREQRRVQTARRVPGHTRRRVASLDSALNHVVGQCGFVDQYIAITSNVKETRRVGRVAQNHGLAASSRWPHDFARENDIAIG
jgi:hypothetical protein